MKLFGQLTELFRMVLRSTSGREVTIQPSPTTASTSDTIFELPGADGGSHSLLDTDSAQTISNKTLDAATISTTGTLEHGNQIDNPSSGVHGVTGSVVGTSDSQTLTNKTIDSSLNTLSGLTHGSQVDNPSSGVHGVTGSIVGTTDSQTLSSKTFSDEVTVEQIVTPATPSTGQTSIYSKADGEIYRLNDSGIEAQLTSSAPATLAGLPEVTLTSPSLDQILRYDGTVFVNVDEVVPVNPTIGSITGVNSSADSASLGQSLVHDGTEFVPTSPSDPIYVSWTHTDGDVIVGSTFASGVALPTLTDITLSGGFTANVANPDQFIAPKTGRYSVIATMQSDNRARVASTNMRLRVTINGGVTVLGTQSPENPQLYSVAMGQFSASAGDNIAISISYSGTNITLSTLDVSNTGIIQFIG